MGLFHLDAVKRREAVQQMTTAELAQRDALRSRDLEVIALARVLCSDSAIALTECKMEGQAKTLIKKVKELDQHVLVVTGKRKPKQPKKARE